MLPGDLRCFASGENLLRRRQSRIVFRPEDGPRDGTDAVLLAALIVRDDPVRVAAEAEIGGHLEVLLAHHAVTVIAKRWKSGR